jgi:PEP-CTERM motif
VRARIVKKGDERRPYWAHIYTGTITPGTGFVNNTFFGTTALYNGVGNGTLDDGVIGTSLSADQLFVTPQASDGTVINPAIFITLPFAYTINTIELYGGDFGGNTIPGILTGVTVTLFGPSGTFSEVFTTTAFGPSFTGGSGPVDDRVTITGPSLDNVPAFLIILSDFQGTELNWFSLTEIKADGQLFPEHGGSVPEPGSLILLGAGAGALGLWILRRRRSQHIES